MLLKFYKLKLLPIVKKRIIILTLIITLIMVLMPANISHTSSDNIQNPSLNVSNYYLAHNITVTSNYSISNENLIAFQQNITIFDYGKLVITNSCIKHTNFSLNIFVNKGILNINNSSIGSNGMIKAINSNLNFNNLTIQNNSNMIFNFNHDKVTFNNSNIRFYSNPIKHVCFTSGKLFGKLYPYDTYGNIPLKETDIYNNSFAGNLSLHLYIRGDNNGTGELELYEFGKFIKNVSLPVHTGYYNYTVNFSLPQDIRTSEFNDTNIFSLKIPEANDTAAGEDGYLSIHNITILTKSNDTESYFGYNNYNMMIYNSSIDSYSSNFHTNMKKFYIYQQVLNPYKKSIFLVNSTFYSYSSNYNGSAFMNSPFYSVNSTVYFYENPEFVFSNAISTFSLKYSTFPDNGNKTSNLIANKINNDAHGVKDFLIFDVQKNNSISYYGDYQLHSGNFEYNFSLPPLPTFIVNDMIKVPVQIPMIAYSIEKPTKLISGQNNTLNLSIKSIAYSSRISVLIEDNKTILYNSSLEVHKNNTVSLPFKIYPNSTANITYKIRYNNPYYNYTDIIYNSSILEFTKTNTKITEYTLIIKSPELDWNVVLNGTNISENGKVAMFTLEKGHYLLTMYKAGYTKQTYNVNLSDNMTLYISMHKLYHSNRVPYIFYISISAVVVGSVIGILAYSKRTITCKNCGTRHYATFDKCPVCLTPVKHAIYSKRKDR